MVGARHWHEFVVEGNATPARAGQRADQTWIIRPRGASGISRAKAAPGRGVATEMKQVARNFSYARRYQSRRWQKIDNL